MLKIPKKLLSSDYVQGLSEEQKYDLFLDSDDNCDYQYFIELIFSGTEPLHKIKKAYKEIENKDVLKQLPIDLVKISLEKERYDIGKFLISEIYS